MAEIHVWNTGCKYTAKGQRIAYCELPDGRVAFLDRDRGIDGVMVRAPIFLENSQYSLQNWVHQRYLRNEYSSGIPYEFRDIEIALRKACDEYK
jgi:hypothetical protein